MEGNNFLLKVAILKGRKVYNYINGGDICEKHMHNSIHKFERRLDRSAIHFSNIPPPPKYKKIHWAHIPNSLFTYMRACV